MVLPWWLGDGVIVRGLDDISHLSHRLYIFKATWALIQNMPINGYGLGSFMNLYSGARFEFGSGGYFAHNDYLQLLLEGGPLFLGLLLAYVLFHGWLGLRICFEQRAIVAARKAQYKELLVCVGVAMALSAHALLNYVFYVLSVQLLAAMVLARTVYLARALGYLKRPMLAPATLCVGGTDSTGVPYLCGHGVGGFQKSIHGSWLPANTIKLGEVYRFCPESTDPRPG